MTTLTCTSDTDWAKPDLGAVEAQIAAQPPEVQAAMHHAIDLMHQQVGAGTFDAGTQAMMQRALDASLAKLEQLRRSRLKSLAAVEGRGDFPRDEDRLELGRVIGRGGLLPRMPALVDRRAHGEGLTRAEFEPQDQRVAKFERAVVARASSAAA